MREGDTATEILGAAAEDGCDLIVLGTHGRTGLGRALMGSVAEAVLAAPLPRLDGQGSRRRRGSAKELEPATLS